MMKKFILVSLFISVCFSYNKLTSKNIDLHSHNHIHIQGSTHTHEHIHVDNNFTLFYNSPENRNDYELLKLVYNNTSSAFSFLLTSLRYYK